MSLERKKILASEHSTGGLTVAQIELNAPEKYNALDTDMLSQIHQRLKIWENDPQVALVIFSSTQKKAFCAGGDVKGLALGLAAAQDSKTAAHTFFETEYALDHYVHRYQKPVVALTEGILMGGGLGLINGATVRAVTETSVVAMPELAIGFFPDVGASYFLPRLNGGIGFWMGLLGLRLTGHEAVRAGLADVCVSGQHLRKIHVDLLRIPWMGRKTEDEKILRGYFSDLPKGQSSGAQDPLTESFFNSPPSFSPMDFASVHAMETALEADLKKRPGGPTALSVYQGFSPLSREATFELFKKCANLTLADCFAVELALAINLTTRGDFYEGVRAQLIDKDKKPKWSATKFSKDFFHC
jgi:enoyl-CoA hydratase/carnithine racemase